MKKDIITQETRLYYNNGRDHYRLEDRVYVPIDTVLKITDEVMKEMPDCGGGVQNFYYPHGWREAAKAIKNRVLALKGDEKVCQHVGCVERRCVNALNALDALKGGEQE